MRVLGDVLRGQPDGALPFAAGAVLFRPHRPVRPDRLHRPGLPVRHLHIRVVLPRLDHIAHADAQAVAAGGRAVVVDQAGAHARLSDARVQLAGLVVGRGRDRVPVAGVAGDRLLHRLRALVQRHEPEGVQPVEQQRGMLAPAHLHGQVCIGGVGEAMHGRHVIGARRELRGHVEHTAAPDRGELRPVPDQGEGRAVLVRDG